MQTIVDHNVVLRHVTVFATKQADILEVLNLMQDLIIYCVNKDAPILNIMIFKYLITVIAYNWFSL